MKSTHESYINNPKELQHHRQQLKFYTPLATLFVSLFIVVNLVTQKIVTIGGSVILTAGDFIYPLNYILSIVLTEVYGYTMSRRVIWSAFLCNLFATLAIILSIILPEATTSWHDQEPYAMILGRTPRLLAASLGAFLIGEFIGTCILAKVKIFTAGKHLWLRTIGATTIGQAIDSAAFTVMAFTGILSWHDILMLSFAAYGCKLVYQTLLTPIISIFTKFLKKQEKIDIFDHNTNFNPFHLGLE